MLLAGFLPLTNASLSILLFALGFLVVLSDAFLDVAFQLAAQADGQLSQLKRDLIVFVLLRELLHDLDNAFALLRVQTVDLTD